MSDTTLRGLATSADAGRVISPFEFWPDWLFYTPVVLYWMALGLRYGNFSLPSSANPGITMGGLCGESKSEILDLVHGPGRDWVAPYVKFDTGERVSPADFAAAEAARMAGGLDYPLVLKPDIGCNGAGVRFLPDAVALERALPDYPRGVRLLLQRFVPYEGEAGIFYVRHPGEARGRLTSLTLKIAPSVVGDGRSSLRELILADPRAGKVPQLYLPRLAARLDEVPPTGEPVRLVFSGNHCKGSIFRDGRAEITKALADRVEGIARSMPDFHFGRLDVRFASLAELHKGEGFVLIEANGVGSEATHIWDPDCSLREAYRAQFWHYGAAFRIGREMRARGHRPHGVFAMLRLWRLQKRLMAAYPMND